LRCEIVFRQGFLRFAGAYNKSVAGKSGCTRDPLPRLLGPNGYAKIAAAYRAFTACHSVAAQLMLTVPRIKYGAGSYKAGKQIFYMIFLSFEINKLYFIYMGGVSQTSHCALKQA